jgi:phosphoribosylanthranilate isomerase
MRVKVCGMTLPEQIEALSDLGVLFAGMIFYPKSPRFVLRHMSLLQIKAIQNIHKVGVFVNTPADEVLRTVDECRLQMVQLHGDESPRDCERISDYVSVVKAFRMSDHDSPEWMVKPYVEACDMFLFDTLGAGYGGTGKKFDWQVLAPLDIGKPYFLSGGIQPNDYESLHEFSGQPAGRALFALDINSGFEVAPGVKDLERIKLFMHNLQQKPSL